MRCAKIIIQFLLAFSFPLILSQSVLARDLQGRLGLGYNDEFVNFDGVGGVPAISLKYGTTREFAIEGIVGLSTANPHSSVVGGKVYKNIFYETSLNFYFTTGIASISALNQSGVQIIGGFGAEAFIPDLESLGFSMETGGSLDNISGSFAFRTLGVSFLNAGIHFYF